MSKLLAKTGVFWVQKKEKIFLFYWKTVSLWSIVSLLVKEITGRAPNMLFFSDQLKELVDG